MDWSAFFQYGGALGMVLAVLGIIALAFIKRGGKVHIEIPPAKR